MIGHLLKAKLLVVLIGATVIVGGGTAVFAATPAGQNALHAITGANHSDKSVDATATATTKPGHNGQGNGNGNDNGNGNGNTCAGDATAQNLATEFSLSAASASDALLAICELHAGTFTGTIPGGSAVTSSRVYGYGEIEDLLTYAKFLASQDKSNQGGALTTDNARGYLAEAIQSCGTMPLEPCLQKNIPGFHPGNGNGNGNGGNKPTPTPTAAPTPGATPTP